MTNVPCREAWPKVPAQLWVSSSYFPQRKTFFWFRIQVTRFLHAVRTPESGFTKVTFQPCVAPGQFTLLQQENMTLFVESAWNFATSYNIQQHHRKEINQSSEVQMLCSFPVFIVCQPWFSHRSTRLSCTLQPPTRFIRASNKQESVCT